MTRRDQPEDNNSHLLSAARKTRGNANTDPKESDLDGIYVRWGKQVHRKYLGFGTMGSAFFAGRLISDAVVQAANEDDSAQSLSHLKNTIEKHKREGSVQYHLMTKVATKTISKFPEIREDCHRIRSDDQDAPHALTSRLKQITRGMKAARQADTCRLKGAILELAKYHAARLGQPLDTGLKKDQRGLKNEATACLLLPYQYHDEYCQNPKRFRAHVDRGNVTIDANEWPAFLYDDTMYDPKQEWVGLFLGETFVRACICILVSPSAASEWPYGTPSAKTYAASNKKGNADLNDITEITAEVVAGLVCQVTFALSDAPNWKDKIGDMDLIELYTNTVQMLDMDNNWVDNTIDTLQSWILGEKEETEQEDRDAIARERFKKLSEMIAQSEGNPREGRTQFESSSRAIRAGQDDMDLDDSWFSPQRPPPPGATKTEEAPRKKRIHRRPSSPSAEAEPISAPNTEEPDHTPDPEDNRRGTAKPTPNRTKSPQFSFDYASIRTSPPSIPQSTQFRTQGRLPTQRSSQSQTRTPQTPAPPPRSQLDTSTTRTPRNKPSTSHQASPARTSQGRQSAPRRTQDPITPSQAGPRSSQGNAGASRTRISLPKVPAKRPAPTQDNEPFWDSPLTEDSPLPPARRTRSQKRKSRNPGHKSQRTTSQVSEND